MAAQQLPLSDKRGYALYLESNQEAMAWSRDRSLVQTIADGLSKPLNEVTMSDVAAYHYLNNGQAAGVTIDEDMQRTVGRFETRKDAISYLDQNPEAKASLADLSVRAKIADDLNIKPDQVNLEQFAQYHYVHAGVSENRPAGDALKASSASYVQQAEYYSQGVGLYTKQNPEIAQMSGDPGVRQQIAASLGHSDPSQVTTAQLVAHHLISSGVDAASIADPVLAGAVFRYEVLEQAATYMSQNPDLQNLAHDPSVKAKIADHLNIKPEQVSLEHVAEFHFVHAGSAEGRSAGAALTAAAGGYAQNMQYYSEGVGLFLKQNPQIQPMMDDSAVRSQIANELNIPLENVSRSHIASWVAVHEPDKIENPGDAKFQSTVESYKGTVDFYNSGVGLWLRDNPEINASANSIGSRISAALALGKNDETGRAVPMATVAETAIYLAQQNGGVGFQSSDAEFQEQVASYEATLATRGDLSAPSSSAPGGRNHWDDVDQRLIDRSIGSLESAVVGASVQASLRAADVKPGASGPAWAGVPEGAIPVPTNFTGPLAPGQVHTEQQIAYQSAAGLAGGAITAGILGLLKGEDFDDIAKGFIVQQGVQFLTTAAVNTFAPSLANTIATSGVEAFGSVAVGNIAGATVSINPYAIVGSLALNAVLGDVMASEEAQIGATIGAVVGQVLIPIPVVGGLIGQAFGAIVGSMFEDDPDLRTATFVNSADSALVSDDHFTSPFGHFGFVNQQNWDAGIRGGKTALESAIASLDESFMTNTKPDAATLDVIKSNLAATNHTYAMGYEETGWNSISRVIADRYAAVGDGYSENIGDILRFTHVEVPGELQNAIGATQMMASLAEQGQLTPEAIETIRNERIDDFETKLYMDATIKDPSEAYAPDATPPIYEAVKAEWIELQVHERDVYLNVQMEEREVITSGIPPESVAHVRTVLEVVQALASAPATKNGPASVVASGSYHSVYQAVAGELSHQGLQTLTAEEEEYVRKLDTAGPADKPLFVEHPLPAVMEVDKNGTATYRPGYPAPEDDDVIDTLEYLQGERPPPVAEIETNYDIVNPNQGSDSAAYEIANIPVEAAEPYVEPAPTDKYGGHSFEMENPAPSPEAPPPVVEAAPAPPPEAAPAPAPAEAAAGLVIVGYDKNGPIYG